MRAQVHIGEAETHALDLFMSFWSGLEVVTVDGQEVHRRRNFWPWSSIHFDLGTREFHHVELRCNALAMTSRLYVDGRLARRCVFPQVKLYSALTAAVLLLLAAAGWYFECPWLTYVPAERARQSAQEALDRGEYEEAVARFTEAERLGLSDSYLYHNRGAAYYGKGDHDRALADFTRALEIDPRSPRTLLWRGDAFLARNNYDRALADYKEALRLAPNLEAARRRCERVERAKAAQRRSRKPPVVL